MNEADRRVRFRIYATLAASGRPPTTDECAAALSMAPEEVTSSFESLARQRLLVLAPGGHAIWMAHPFSGVPTPFEVTSGGRLYWANCAWDSLAIASILDGDARIESHCGDCGAANPVTVRKREVTSSCDLIHHVVPAMRFWDNVGFT